MCFSNYLRRFVGLALGGLGGARLAPAAVGHHARDLARDEVRDLLRGLEPVQHQHQLLLQPRPVRHRLLAAHAGRQQQERLCALLLVQQSAAAFLSGSLRWTSFVILINPQNEQIPAQIICALALSNTPVGGRLGVEDGVPGLHEERGEAAGAVTLPLLQDEVPVDPLRLPEPGPRHQDLPVMIQITESATEYFNVIRYSLRCYPHGSL